jgi:hypothetical protein
MSTNAYATLVGAVTTAATPALFTATNIAARYARAVVSANVTGTGASVTVLVSGV